MWEYDNCVQMYKDHIKPLIPSPEILRKHPKLTFQPMMRIGHLYKSLQSYNKYPELMTLSREYDICIQFLVHNCLTHLYTTVSLRYNTYYGWVEKRIKQIS